MNTMSHDQAARLRSMANLTHYHREREKFSGAAPRETAVALQRHSRTLTRIKRELRDLAAQASEIGSWLEEAMQSSVHGHVKVLAGGQEKSSR